MECRGKRAGAEQGDVGVVPAEVVACIRTTGPWSTTMLGLLSCLIVSKPIEYIIKHKQPTTMAIQWRDWQ